MKRLIANAILTMKMKKISTTYSIVAALVTGALMFTGPTVQANGLTEFARLLLEKAGIELAERNVLGQAIKTGSPQLKSVLNSLPREKAIPMIRTFEEQALVEMENHLRIARLSAGKDSDQPVETVLREFMKQDLEDLETAATLSVERFTPSQLEQAAAKLLEEALVPKAAKGSIIETSESTVAYFNESGRMTKATITIPKDLNDALYTPLKEAEKKLMDGLRKPVEKVEITFKVSETGDAVYPLDEALTQLEKKGEAVRVTVKSSWTELGGAKHASTFQVIIHPQQWTSIMQNAAKNFVEETYRRKLTEDLTSIIPF